MLLAPIFVSKNQSVAICRCSSFFAKGHIRVGYSVASALINAFGSLPTFCEAAPAAQISRGKYDNACRFLLIKETCRDNSDNRDNRDVPYGTIGTFPICHVFSALCHGKYFLK